MGPCIVRNDTHRETSLHPFLRSPLLLAAFLTIRYSGAVVADRASPDSLAGRTNLEDIVTERCHRRPPSKDGSADACPALIGDLMDVFEGRLDSTIQVADFDAFVERADFTSPPDKAIFWLRFLGDDSGHESDSSVAGQPSDLVSPEDTPGGALMRDLVFCGIDRHSATCEKDDSNAFWKFWQACYSEFASHVTGHVSIVVEPMADVQFLIKAGISCLKQDQISSVTIYGMDSTCDSAGPEKLLLSLNSAGFEGVTCEDNMSKLLRGNKEHHGASEKDNTTASAKTEELEEPVEPVQAAQKKGRHPLSASLIWFIFLSTSGLIIGYFDLYKNGCESRRRKIGYQQIPLNDHSCISITDEECLSTHEKGNSSDLNEDALCIPSGTNVPNHDENDGNASNLRIARQGTRYFLDISRCQLISESKHSPVSVTHNESLHLQEADGDGEPNRGKTSTTSDADRQDVPNVF